MDVLRLLGLLFTVQCCSCYSLWCFTCNLKDQCFTLDPADHRQQTQCAPGTTHCIMERIVSAATGAVVENRMCGGQVYIDKNLPLADGCYVVSRQEDSRVNSTRCYCSTSYCNTAQRNTQHLGVTISGTLLMVAVTRWLCAGTS